jgi:hypothetical protein
MSFVPVRFTGPFPGIWEARSGTDRPVSSCRIRAGAACSYSSGSGKEVFGMGGPSGGKAGAIIPLAHAG